MNQIWMEIKLLRKSLLFWTIGIGLVMLIAFSEFSVYQNNPSNAEIIELLPKSMIKMFKINEYDMTTFSGFLGMLSTNIILFLTIHATMIGSGVIAKEGFNKTAEFTYSLPVKRETVITKKVLVALFNCLVLLLVVVSIIVYESIVYQVNSSFYKPLFLLTISIFCIQTLCVTTGVLVATALKRHKFSNILALIITISLYFLTIISSATVIFSFFSKISPYGYFDIPKIINNSEISYFYVIISLLLSVLMYIVACRIYKKRDISI